VNDNQANGPGLLSDAITLMAGFSLGLGVMVVSRFAASWLAHTVRWIGGIGSGLTIVLFATCAWCLSISGS